MQSTGLLDHYLQATGSKTSPLERTVKGDLHTNSSASAKIICHQGTTNDVHQASDTVLASSGRLANSSGQTWLGALADLTSRTIAVGQDQKQSTSPGKGSLLASSSNRTPQRRLKGIFRSMRQADAAVMLEQKLQKDQEQQQQPIFAVPADHANGAVRILASNAALQAKLQRLQAGMDTKSYRQDLLQQLQTPGALLQPPCQPPQQGHDRQWHCRNNNRSQGVFQGLAPSCGAPRPATSPAAIGQTLTHHPARDCSSAVAQGMQHSINSWSEQPADAGPTAVRAQQGHRQLAEAAPQLQHLRELAEYEPPWPAMGVAAAAAAHHRGCCDSSNPGAVYKTSGKSRHRPWTSSGTPVTRHTGLDSIRVRQAAQAQVRAGAQGARRRHDTPNRSESQQQQQHVARPASAVAALEQSLSELALLRSRLSQQQQQCFPQQQQQQQASLWSTSDGQAFQHQYHASTVSQQQQQKLSSGSWLSDPSLSRTPGAPGNAALGPSTSHARPDNCIPARTTNSPVHLPGPGVLGQQSQEQALHNSHHARQRCSPSLGYSRWGAWQEQIHRHAVAVVDAGDCFRKLRSQSAPRPTRAWDALPLQRTPAAEAATSNRKLRYSSSGRLTGHLQLHSRQQQQQRRPRTTGGIEGHHQRRLHEGMRLCGMQDEHVDSVPKNSASVARLRCNAGGLASSAWLLSSPLQRAKQYVAAGAVRSKSTTVNGGTALAAAPAGNRARAVAAALAGPRRSESTPAAAPAVTAARRHVPGRTAAATAQLLQSLRVNEDASCTAGVAGHTGWAPKHSAVAAVHCTRNWLHADSLSLMPGRSSSSPMVAGPGGCAVYGAQAPLTKQLLEYASQRYKSPLARGSRHPGVDDSSSDSSGESPPARRGRGQANTIHLAYAAALARLNAAKSVSWVDASSDTNSD